MPYLDIDLNLRKVKNETKNNRNNKKYNLINSGDKIVLGVSGGPDSIAMLDILNQLKDEMNFEIYVVHVNHNIRGKDADEDEEYVKKIL